MVMVTAAAPPSSLEGSSTLRDLAADKGDGIDRGERQPHAGNADPERLGHHRHRHAPAGMPSARSTAYSLIDAAVAECSVWLVTTAPTSNRATAASPRAMPALVLVSQCHLAVERKVSRREGRELLRVLFQSSTTFRASSLL